MFGAVAAGATTRPELSLLVLACATGSLACVSTLNAAVATAAVAWALQAGFVHGRHGELAFTPNSFRDAIALVAVALLVFGVATAIRVIRHRDRSATVAIPVQRSPAAASRVRSAWPTHQA